MVYSHSTQVQERMRQAPAFFQVPFPDGAFTRLPSVIDSEAGASCRNGRSPIRVVGLVVAFFRALAFVMAFRCYTLSNRRVSARHETMGANIIEKQQRALGTVEN